MDNSFKIPRQHLSASQLHELVADVGRRRLEVDLEEALQRRPDLRVLVARDADPLPPDDVLEGVEGEHGHVLVASPRGKVQALSPRVPLLVNRRMMTALSCSPLNFVLNSEFFFIEYVLAC